MCNNKLRSELTGAVVVTGVVAPRGNEATRRDRARVVTRGPVVRGGLSSPSRRQGPGTQAYMGYITLYYLHAYTCVYNLWCAQIKRVIYSIGGGRSKAQDVRIYATQCSS